MTIHFVYRKRRARAPAAPTVAAPTESLHPIEAVRARIRRRAAAAKEAIDHLHAAERQERMVYSLSHIVAQMRDSLGGDTDRAMRQAITDLVALESELDSFDAASTAAVRAAATTRLPSMTDTALMTCAAHSPIFKKLS